MADIESIPEVKRLLALLQARRELLPLKALFLKGATVELNAAHAIGLPWKDIWRVLVEHGYRGSYQQFWRMALLLNGVTPSSSHRRKNLPALTGGKAMGRIELRPEEQPEQINRNQEKPEWQIRREQEMARLDREAELNRQRESRAKATKVFKPSVFVGRSKD